MLTIIFSNSKNYNPFLFWFRKYILKHQSTHVGFGIEKDSEPYVFHMSGKGAVRTPRSTFLAKNDVIQEYRILPDLSPDLQHHLKYLGAPYDQVSAVMHFIVALFRPLKQLLIFYQIRTAFYCANFARQLDNTNKLKSWRNINCHWATVEELQEACQNSSEFEEISRHVL